MPTTTRANGAAIRVIRERSGMSIADVVEAVHAQGVSLDPDHLRNVELGHRNPSPKLLDAIATALKVAKIALIADVAA